VKTIGSLSDLIPDDKNANKGTERGRKILEHSMRRFGAGRSIVVDRNGKIIGGNKTTEVAADIGMDDVITVVTNGTKLVVVQRDDLDLDRDPEARAMAVADNRASELGLEWDPAMLADLVKNDDKLLADLFGPRELDAILASLPDESAWLEALSGVPSGEKAPFQQMTFTLSEEQAEIVNQALNKAKEMGSFIDTGNANSNGNALARICEVFLGIS
jgi:protein tyrosine phosphatase (PTP) superfamily phosphohydrolase (DUF442 family)